MTLRRWLQTSVSYLALTYYQQQCAARTMMTQEAIDYFPARSVYITKLPADAYYEVTGEAPVHEHYYALCDMNGDVLTTRRKKETVEMFARFHRLHVHTVH